MIIYHTTLKSSEGLEVIPLINKLAHFTRPPSQNLPIPMKKASISKTERKVWYNHWYKDLQNKYNLNFW